MMTKYRAGDEVTVRAIVTSFNPSCEFAIKGRTLSGDFFIKEKEIATHTPNPREFMVGDKVRPRSDGLTYELVGIREGYAFLWNGRNKYARVVEERLLFHVDEADQ